MLAAKWLDTKSVMTISTIDIGNATNSWLQKTQEKQWRKSGSCNGWKVQQIHRSNWYFISEDNGVRFSQEDPDKHYYKLFRAYVDMEPANSFTDCEKIVSKVLGGSKENITKAQKISEKWVQLSLLMTPLWIKNIWYRSQPRHWSEYDVKHGRCKKCFQEKKGRKAS